jgi:hypothetical protein
MPALSARSAASRPNRARFQLHANRKKQNRMIPERLPSARPAPLRKPMRPGEATFGSMALRKIAEYSKNR